MSERPVDANPVTASDPLFSREIDDGAMLAGIAAMIVVAGIIVCSVVHRGEAQSVTKNPLPETIGRSIAAPAAKA